MPNFLIILTVFLLDNFSHAADPTDISELRRTLLNGYDKMARPIHDAKQATWVIIQLNIKGFEFDEQRSVFTLHSWTILNWSDEHLRWTPRLHGNITYVHFAAHELWIPDITVYNNWDKSEIDHFGNSRMIVYSSSYIIWVTPTKFQVGCTSDLRNWPVDTQTCKVVLGSWSHDGNELDLRNVHNETSHYTATMEPNREWILVGNVFETHDNFYDCCPGVPFPEITTTFTLQRRSLTHKAAVVAPGLVIAICTLVAFWIQPGTTERLLLILISIIVNALCLNFIYNILPNNGDSVPLVLIYYRNSLMMASVALVWTMCLRYLAASKRTSPVPLPGFIQTFLSSLPAIMLCLDPRPITGGSNDVSRNEITSAEGDESSDFGKLVSFGNPYQDDWAWLAHLLDRVAFTIYFVIYFCFYITLL